MTTIYDAARALARYNDPQGDHYGVAADVSYSFWGGSGNQPFDASQRQAALDAMQAWSDVAQINFFVDNSDPELAYKNYYDASSSAEASTSRSGPGNFNPDTTHVIGFNLATTNGEGLAQGQYDRISLVHEIGHGLGLAHPGDYNAGAVGDAGPTYEANRAFDEDSRQYTIMSYFDESKTGADFGGTYARTPLMYDIAAAQMFYGANMETRTGDTVYGFNSNAGAAYTISTSGEKAVFCIYDAGGNDTLDLSGYSQNQVINLNPGTFSDAGGLKKNISMADAVDIHGNNSWESGFDARNIANLVENAKGGSGDDLMFGNQADNRLDGGAGNDTMWGGDGRDTLIGDRGNDDLHGGNDGDFLYGGDGNDLMDGGAGADIMYGGAGNDTYIVDNVNDWVVDDLGPRGGSADKVITTLNSYNLSVYGKGVGVENLEYNGHGNFVGTGNQLDNIIVSKDGDDRLYGGDGNDLLQAGDGNDTLDGGFGNDTLDGQGGADVMRGGYGDDVYYVDDKGDQVIDIAPRTLGGLMGGFGHLAFGNGGHDTVITTLTHYDLGAANKGVGIEDLKYEGFFGFVGSGNDLDNGITGGQGWDILDGRGGNDVLTGGAGNDVFMFEDHGGHDSITDFKHGEDTINLAHVTSVHSFADLKFTDVAGGVRVDFGDSSVLVAGQQAAGMTADDFSFTEPVEIDPTKLPQLQQVQVNPDPAGPVTGPDPIGPVERPQEVDTMSHLLATLNSHSKLSVIAALQNAHEVVQPVVTPAASTFDTHITSPAISLFDTHAAHLAANHFTVV